MSEKQPYHAWYSGTYDLEVGGAIYKNSEGQDVAVGLVCRDKEEGERHLISSRFKDWKYIGLVVEFVEDYSSLNVPSFLTHFEGSCSCQ